ncbi:MAG TPA: tetratricopeptide repeat protein [Acidisarcina sp.]
MYIDLGSLVKNPIFVFVTGALGGLFGTLLKGWIDVRTSEAKRRQDAGTHFFQQIELLAPSYYLMSNYSYLLAWHLESYIQKKQQQRMTLQDPDQSTSKPALEDVSEIARDVLFEAGKFYRTISDQFFSKGGDYVVPDQWANESLNQLHDTIMNLIRFDANVLLKYITAETQRHQFFAKLALSDQDEKLTDLKTQYAAYTDWVRKQHKEVKQLAVASRAYADLFSLEMKRIYKDVWSRTPDDPLHAHEVAGTRSLRETGEDLWKRAGLKARRLSRWAGRNPPGGGPPDDHFRDFCKLAPGTRDLIQKCAMANDRLQERLAALQRVGASSDQADAYESLGWSYYEAQQWDLAIGEFKKAIEACPSSAAAHNGLANTYTQKNDFDNAARTYESLHDRPNPVYKHNYGKMRSRQKQFGEAVILLQDSIERGKDPDHRNDADQALRYNDLGLAYFYDGKWDESAAAYGEAIVLMPLEPVLYSNLAQTYEANYDGQAKAGAAQAQAIQAGSANAGRSDLGVRPVPQEQTQPPVRPPDLTLLKAAAAEYSMAASLTAGDDASEYQRSAAAIYRKAARFGDASRFYQQALEQAAGNPQKRRIFLEFAAMAEGQSQWNQAVNALTKALELGDNTSSTAERLIRGLQRAGDGIARDFADLAIKACRAQVAANPNDLIHRERLANIFYATGDFVRRLDELDSIVQIANRQRKEDSDPAIKSPTLRVGNEKMADYYRQLGLAYEALDIRDMALSCYQRALELNFTPTYQRSVGLALQANRRFDEARAPLLAARKERPDDIDLMLSLVEVYAYSSTPEVETALSLCREGAEKYPANPGPHFLLGRLLVIQKNFIDAAAEYQKAIDLTRQAKDRGEDVGGELDRYYKEGIEAYELAIEANPDRVALHYGRAQLLTQLTGRDNDAIEGYKKALEQTTAQQHDDWRLLSISIQNSLANLLYRGDDYAGAQKAWEDALDTAKQLSTGESLRLPTAPFGSINLVQIRNNLGTAYEALGIKDKALDCYRFATEKSPQAFPPHFNLAQLLYRTEQYVQGLSEFQQGLRLGPPKVLAAKTRFYIGNCFYRLRRPDIAIEKWEEVVGSGVDIAAAHYNLGRWFWLNGNLEKAAQYWQQALNLSPTILEAEYNLGVLSLKQNKKDEAVVHWKKVVGEKGYEQLAELIRQVEAGEKTAEDIGDGKSINIRDISDQANG